MNIFDAHCDVLYKMWLNPHIDFYYDASLHTNYHYIKQTGEKNIQCFAIYIPTAVHEDNRFQVALEMIDIFYEKILMYHDIKLLLTKNDAHKLKANEIGAILTLEGCDAIGRDLTKLKTLFRLGVRSVGLTWNEANAVADGVLEPRGAGLTSFGEKVIQLNNEFHIWTDASHLSEKGFWDMIEIADYPIASHSNAQSIAKHPRNLTDEQIRALFAKNGVIGLTFVPEFLTGTGQASMHHLFHHIDHLCFLGGESQIGFGSDFDGIDETPHKLNNYSFYQKLIDELLRCYPERIVKGLLYNNFLKRISF